MILRGAFAALLIASAPAVAAGVAGEFDFYVLSLSWTPTYCATDPDPDPASCGADDDGFTVHGLWPEYEIGYPEDCESPEPRWLERRVFDTVAGIMPGLGFAGYQWRRHGICGGLSQDAYFALVRRAHEKIAFPPELTAPRDAKRTSPGRIEEAFVAANPGLTPAGIAVTCHRGLIDEVRICLTKALNFCPCEEIDRNACPLASISVPTR